MRITKLLPKFSLLRDERGQIAILVGVLLVPMMLAMGLVIDGGLLFFEHRGNRNAADAGALAATRVIWDNPGMSYNTPEVDCTAAPNAAVLAACLIATSAPFNLSPDEVRVAIPPNQGPLAGRPNHVQVVVTTERPTFLMRIMGPESSTVAARAVGGLQESPPLYAIYALSNDACEGLGFGGNIDLTVTGGGIKVNASCVPPPKSALEASSGTTVSANPIDVVGDADTGNAVITGGVYEGTTTPILDPLGSLPELVSAWVDTADPGSDPDAAVLSAECSDDRCTAIYSDTYKGYALTSPVGVVGGSLRTPYYVGAISLQNPNAYDACSPSTPEINQPGYGLMRTLFPGVYPGGITMSNCDVFWERGVYVLPGRKNPGSNSLEMTPSSNKRVLAPNGVLIYVTDDPFAAASKKPAGEVQFHTSGGMGGSTIDMSAGGAAQCPPRSGMQDILLFIDRDGPGGAPDDTGSLVGGYDPGDCNNTSGSGCRNSVTVSGGGAQTSLSGTLYDRTGRFFATGSYTLANTQLIFNVVQMQNSIANISCKPGGEAGFFNPRLRE